MNINSIAVSGLNNVKNTSFSSNSVKENNTPDRFEKSTYYSPDDRPMYPRMLVYRPINRQRKRLLDAEEKKCAQFNEEKTEKIAQIRKDYSDLDSRVENLIVEMEDFINASFKMSLNMLKKEIANSSRDLENRKHYARMYTIVAERLGNMISELDELQAKLDEHHENGNAKLADITDKRINISPENMDYYRELASFDPYSLIEQ